MKELNLKGFRDWNIAKNIDGHYTECDWDPDGIYSDGWIGCYKSGLAIPKMNAFLGQEVKDIFEVYIAERANNYHLKSDLLFVIEKEDGTIEGSFLHCNYKMIWKNALCFLEYLGKKEREEWLYDGDELDRLLGEEDSEEA